MAGRKSKEGRHVLLRLGLVIYGILMLWLLFGQRIGNQSDLPYWDALLGNLNLQPTHTIQRYIRLLQGDYSGYLKQHAFINLFGNIVMFVPLGILLPGIWKGMRRFLPFLFCGIGIIVSIELIQLFTLLGSCDVDDLLLNIVGISIGFMMRKLLFERKK